MVDTAPTLDCLLQPIEQMQASKPQIFGYIWHLLLFSNESFQAQIWQKAEKFVPK